MDIKKILDINVIDTNFKNDKLYFIENFSMLVNSGMSIVSSIESIETEIKSFKLKKILKTLKEEVKSGKVLWKALDDTKLFSSYAITLIRIGENTGRLAQNLVIISEQEEREKDLKSKIGLAVTYPALVFILTIVVGIGITWFILPKLSKVFGQLDVELPALTKILISLGMFLEEYGVIATPLFFIFLALIFYFLFFYKKTRIWGQKLLFAIPITKKIIEEVELSRFGYLFGILLESGTPLIDSIKSLEESSLFFQYREFYVSLTESIEEGYSFNSAIKRFKNSKNIIPRPVQQLILSGEESGNLSDVFLKIGHIYKTKLDREAKMLGILLEPIILVVVWMGVVLVALAVILPVYSLIGNFRINKQSPAPVIQRTEEIEIIEQEDGEFLIIRSSNSSIRFSPSSNAPILIENVMEQEEFKYVEEKDGWYKILLDDETYGWIEENYIDILER